MDSPSPSPSISRKLFVCLFGLVSSSAHILVQFSLQLAVCPLQQNVMWFFFSLKKKIASESKCFKNGVCFPFSFCTSPCHHHIFICSETLSLVSLLWRPYLTAMIEKRKVKNMFRRSEGWALLETRFLAAALGLITQILPPRRGLPYGQMLSTEMAFMWI